MRRVKHVLSYVLVLSMCFTLFFFPVPVHADSSYLVVNANTCVSFKGTDRYFYTVESDIETRAVGIKVDANHVHVFFCSLNNFIYSRTWTTNETCSIPNTGSTSGAINDGGVMVSFFTTEDVTVTESIVQNLGIPIYQNRTNYYRQDAYYYTFGDGSVDPGPTYGKVADVEYATRIAGSGLASADNIDRIVWNQSVDTNGNELPTGARVQIRAVPGKYVGNTANDVLNKTYTDFVLDHSKQLIIVDIIASRGVYETKWSEVVDHFGFFPYSWVPNIQYLDNEYFKMGWIYQIRLQVGDYYSEWTNIYTATGSGASESQTITDSDEISQQLVQDINIVNQLNNTTTTNWYINETTINNSEYTENTNGKPWWAYLLEAILSLFQIGDNEQQTINNTNNLNIDLNDKLNEYNEIEDQQLNNLDTNLEAIEVQSDMLEDNKFIGSANWVAQQYTRMTNGTVIGSLIGFSLLFGLALIFIGKIR